MKKLTIISAIALSGLIFNTADAQIRVHLGFNFGPRPVVYQPAPVVVQEPVYQEQQPVVYNDNSDDYYYLPDVDAYYDVTQQCYFYNDGDNWISAAYLPGEYRYYDWRNARRFEVRASRPYMHADFYRSRYDGHRFNGWAHGGFEHRDGYAFNNNRSFDHRDNRNFYDRGFDHRDNHNFDNRGNNGFDRRDEHRFDNRGQGGYTQPQQNRGNFGQPQQNRGNDQQFNGGHASSAQPSNQRGGNQRDYNRGGDNHFAQNGPRGGFSDRRVMTRF